MRQLKMTGLLTILYLMLMSCGTNLYSVLTSEDSEEYALKQAEILIDQAEYAKAEEFLAKVEASSNKKIYRCYDWVVPVWYLKL